MPQAHVTMDVRQAGAEVGIIDVRGEFTAFAEEVLMEAYHRATATGARVIILNFEGLEYMNSRGIGLLVTLLIRVNREKQKLLTYGLSEHYRDIFQITRLDDAIATYDSEDDAIRAAQKLGTP
jgi:anti-sigma B factor antagonist